MKRTKICLLLLPVFALICVAFSPSRTFAISSSENAPYALFLDGKWHVNPAADVQNAGTINDLISCESQGQNIARPDSNHLVSFGILQFNGTSTWEEAEARFGFYGSPMIPSDAVHMADEMISAGMLGRWSCAHLLKLVQ